MDKFIIHGGNALKGEIIISGSKNASLPILPATLLARGVFKIDNVPNITDTYSMIEILRHLNAEVTYDPGSSSLKIDTTNAVCKDVTPELTKKMRASYYLLGALLGMYHHANVAMPGGDTFGVRPIDLHLKGFEKLGAKVDTEHVKDPATDKETDVIKAKAEKLLGNYIYFDKVSVGATINTMLAAVRARGITVIENAAREPHIVATASFLNLMGAQIRGAGTRTITIHGVSELHGCNYTIIPDQIEAGTYMVAAAATGGDLLIINAIANHLEPISKKLRECGATVEDKIYVVKDEKIYDAVRVCAAGRLYSCNIKTEPHPGFPTDMQAQFSAMLCTCLGNSLVEEGVWGADRFRYTEQLKLMGANLLVSGSEMFVESVEKLKGCEVEADDIRAGAALVIAGLCAEGTTVISNVHHIERGYEDIVAKLTAVGADISRRTFPDPPKESQQQKSEDP